MTLEYSELLIIIGFLSIICISFIVTNILKSKTINKLRETNNELEKKYAELRSEKAEGESGMLSLEEARKHKPNYFK